MDNTKGIDAAELVRRQRERMQNTAAPVATVPAADPARVPQQYPLKQTKG